MKVWFHYSLEGFSNGYLVANEKTGEAVIIDPGTMSRELLAHVESHRYKVDGVLVTHNHPSHHNGLITLMRIYSPKVYAADAELGGQRTVLLQGDGTFAAAGFAIRYYAVPGHSPDSLMFQIEHALFTGDALSAGRLGTTNNIYGKRNLLTHLKNKLLSQNDNMSLFPGHGPPSTIRAERFFNSELMKGSGDEGEHGDSKFIFIGPEPF